MRRVILASIGAAAMLAPVGSVHAERDEVTSLLNRYYALNQQGDAEQAARTLREILVLEPEHAEAWRALGYYHQSREQHRQAAQAFAMAARGDPPDTPMLMAAGYAYQAAALDGEAAQQFRAASHHARSVERYADACRAYTFTAPLMRSRIDAPWGLSVYSDTVHLSRFDNTVTENRLRLHRYLDAPGRISLYGQLAYQDDTRSQVRGGVAEIYNDNYTSLGVGIDWRPHPSVRLYMEANRYRDQLDRPSLRRYRSDPRGGVSAFHAWGAPPECRLRADWPLQAYGQAYGSLEYVERYDNLLGQATLWQGVRLFEWRMTSLSAYAKVNLLWDSEGLFYNNLVETGPGLSWRPSLAWPVELRLERLFGHYLDEAGPGGYRFSNTRLQVIVNFDL